MRAFDELKTRNKSIPYEQYFGEMDITDEQKEERIETAQDFEEMLLFIFSLFAVMNQYQYDNADFIISQLESRYRTVVESRMFTDEYLTYYMQDFAEQTIETTQKHSDDEWYLSEDRAMFIAENEANTVLNYSDFQKAIESGKTKKKWLTMRDKKVRDTHKELDGKTIGITDVFLVGDSEMFFPKDTSLDASAEEIVGCRCSIKYF